MTLAPPRPPVRPAAGRRAPTADLLRWPDPLDDRMLTHRAGWLTVAHLLVPGSAQVLAGNRRLGRFALGLWLTGWVLLVVAVALWFLLPQALLTVPTNAVGLTLVQVVLAGLAVLHLVLTVDTLRLLRLVRVRPVMRIVTATVLVVALVAGVGGAAWAALLAGTARDTVGDVFTGSRYELPADGRYNVLVLGGDAGAGRSGLRPDSISVVSIDAISGEMVTFGLPRDLGRVPFPEDSPMHETYPDGYGANGCDVDVCQLNSIYTEVELKSPERYPDAEAQGSSPGIEATRDAAEGALGIEIQYFVLIDMGAFEDLIDALGGVTVDVKQRLPIGGSVDASGNLVGVEVWIEEGRQKLNGNRALWYARSRYGTAGGDYDRMQRQRELQAAILKQVNPVTVLTRFGRVAKAGSKAVRTDLPQGLAGVFTGLGVKARGQKATDVDFTPPRVPDTSAPDYAAIRATVEETLAG